MESPPTPVEETKFPDMESPPKQKTKVRVDDCQINYHECVTNGCLKLLSSIQGITGNLVFAISAAAFGSAFQHGYNTGVVNAGQSLVQKFIEATYKERNADKVLDKETLDTIWSIMVAIFCVGGVIGALGTGYIADRIGRKAGLIYNNVFVLIAGLCMAFTKKSGYYELFIIGRFFIGLASGLFAGLAPMYLTEISPHSLKGAIGTIYQLVITISILISNIFGLPSIFGTDDSWPVLFGITIIPAVIMVLTMPFCPESPKHVLIIQGKDVQAQKHLTWLRGTIEVHDEMDEMRQESEQVKLVPKVRLRDMWSQDIYRKPLIISMVVMLSQQLSGINAVMFYSVSIFGSAGLDHTNAIYGTMGVGVINVLMTLASVVLVEKAGRRTLHLVGLGGMAVTTVILTLCLLLKGNIPALSYFAVISVFFFVIFFATGPGSIPWFLVGELFGIGARGMATSIAVGVNWAANFLVGLAFLPLTNLLKEYTFLVFTVLLVIFWFYTYKRVPETKGKSQEQIAALFRQESYNQ
jgi:SP family facilitated glucose transporter-like MFS transporter 1